MIGEIQHDVLLEHPPDRLVQPIANLVVGEVVGMRQLQLRLKPLADRQHRRPLPFEHRLQEVVLGAGRHQLDVDAADGFVEQRLERVAKLRVSQQVLDFFGAWGVGEHHRFEETAVALHRSGE